LQFVLRSDSSDSWPFNLPSTVRSLLCHTHRDQYSTGCTTQDLTSRQGRLLSMTARSIVMLTLWYESASPFSAKLTHPRSSQTRPHTSRCSIFSLSNLASRCYWGYAWSCWCLSRLRSCCLRLRCCELHVGWGYGRRMWLWKGCILRSGDVDTGSYQEAVLIAEESHVALRGYNGTFRLTRLDSLPRLISARVDIASAALRLKHRPHPNTPLLSLPPFTPFLPHTPSEFRSIGFGIRNRSHPTWTSSSRSFSLS